MHHLYLHSRTIERQVFGALREAFTLRYGAKQMSMLKSLIPSIDIRGDVAIVSVSGVLTVSTFSELRSWSFERVKGQTIRCWVARYERAVFAFTVNEMMAHYGERTTYRAEAPCAFVVTPDGVPLLRELAYRAALAGYRRLVATSYQYALAWAQETAAGLLLDELSQGQLSRSPDSQFSVG